MRSSIRPRSTRSVLQALCLVTALVLAFVVPVAAQTSAQDVPCGQGNDGPSAACIAQGQTDSDADEISRASDIQARAAAVAPDFSAGVERFNQPFDTNSDGILTDGGYGVITIVPDGTNSIASPDGTPFAMIEQAGDPGDETGPFSRFDGYRLSLSGGIQVKTQIYLDPAALSAGEGFDFSVAANRVTASHLRDFIFHVTKDTSTGNLLVGVSNNTNFAPREDLETLTHAVISAAGWYTFVHEFYDNGSGVLEVALHVFNAANTSIFTKILSTPADIIGNPAGGNRYLWFTNIDIAGGIPVNGIELTTIDTNPVQRFNGTTIAQSHATVADAVVNAVAGNRIKAAAGLYTGNVTVDKSLTIEGAQAGVAVDGRTAGDSSESTIQGLLMINASNVELTGFTVTNPGQGTGILVKSASDTVMIRENIVNNVGGTGFINANAQGIYLEHGPDNVSILNNRVSNVAAARNTSAGTAKGIYIGDTTATNTSNNVVIQGNVIESITSAANPNRWGAYGIQTNNNAGATNLLIVNNTISNIEGLWAHAIGLERDTPNAIVRANTISNAIDHKNPSDAIAIFFEDNPSSGTVQVGFNSIANTDIGVAIHPKHGPAYPYVVDARNNFWGDDSGPSDGGLGTTDPSTGTAANGAGAVVGPSVRFDPWLGAAAEDVESETLADGASISTPGGELAATYNSGSGGNATVTVAKYSADPSGGSSSGGLIGAGAAYYDLNVVGNSDSNATLSLVLTGGTAGEQLYWFNGSAWKPVRDNSGNSVIADGAGTFTFILGPNSSPKISELTGTPLASGVSPQMAVQPADYESLIPGDAIAVRIVISATDVAGVEFDLTYDSTFIDIDPSTITLGDFVHADFVGQKSASGGIVQVAFSHIQRPAVSGQGIVAILPFTVKDWNVGTYGSSVTTNLALSNIILSDEAGFSLGAVTAQNDDLDLQRAGNVAGIVNLQGRPNAIGKLDITSVRLEPGENLSDGADTNTGAFDITSVPPRTGSNTYDAIASAPGYLTAVYSGLNVATNATTNLSPVTLLGGDATRDQVINIQDLAFIGARFAKAFGSWTGNDSQADINGDNEINILDLTLAGANFGKSGPRVWP